MTTREISIEDALKTVQDGGLIGSPVKFTSGEWGVELVDVNHTSAAEGKVVIVTTSGGRCWGAILTQCAFTKPGGATSHWRVKARPETPQDIDQPKPDAFQGKPARLPDGNWGALIVTAHEVKAGDKVTITTRRGKSWTTSVLEQVGENLYRTAGELK